MNLAIFCRQGKHHKDGKTRDDFKKGGTLIMIYNVDIMNYNYNNELCDLYLNICKNCVLNRSCNIFS